MVNLSYRKENSAGPAVMLVHGYGVFSGIWDLLLPHLRTDHQYLIPELPGAPGQACDAEISMDFYAEYLHRILEKEKFKEVIMIGHSMGGYISLAFADRFPQKLKAIGLFHSHPFADTEPVVLKRKKTISFIQTNGAIPYLKEFFPALFADTFPERNKQLIENSWPHIQQTRAECLIQSLQAMIARNDMQKVLSGGSFPLLQILGKYDQVIPLQSGLKSAALASISMIEILQNSAHMGMMEEPEQSVEIINKFLTFINDRTAVT